MISGKVIGSYEGSHSATDTVRVMSRDPINPT